MYPCTSKRLREQPPTVIWYALCTHVCVQIHYTKIYIFRQSSDGHYKSTAEAVQSNDIFDIFEYVVYNINIEHTDKRLFPDSFVIKITVLLESRAVIFFYFCDMNL